MAICTEKHWKRLFEIKADIDNNRPSPKKASFAFDPACSEWEKHWFFESCSTFAYKYGYQCLLDHAADKSIKAVTLLLNDSNISQQIYVLTHGGADPTC